MFLTWGRCRIRTKKTASSSLEREEEEQQNKKSEGQWIDTKQIAHSYALRAAAGVDPKSPPEAGLGAVVAPNRPPAAEEQ